MIPKPLPYDHDSAEVDLRHAERFESIARRIGDEALAKRFFGLAAESRARAAARD